MMESLLNSPVYILVSKKNFVRYAMPYEVLPIFMCCEVNGKKIFDKEILAALFFEELIVNDYIVLEVKEERRFEYISFSDINKVYFFKQESLDLFLERSYENYDVKSFDSNVIEFDKNNNIKIEIVYPEQMNKGAFTQVMALRDSVNRLIYDEIKDNNDLVYFLERLDDAKTLNSIIDLLFFTDLNKSVENEIQTYFFKICAEYNLSEGWNPVEIVFVFESKINESIKVSAEFQAWVLTVKKIINGESVNIVFDDNGNITLRAMTLVLLNPTIFQIENIKNNSNFLIGEKVYQLAFKFVKARLGYSYLNADERLLVGGNRELLQNIIAFVYNMEKSANNYNFMFESVKELSDYNELNVQPNITTQNWLKIISENEDEIIFSINGIKPMAGFDLNIIYEKQKKLLLRIIDRNSSKGMSKFKGQFAQNLVELQKDLPNNSRFEINEKGLVLILPLFWINEINLAGYVKELFDILKPLSITQKSSKLVDDLFKL